MGTDVLGAPNRVRSAEILGVSHLVLSVREVAGAADLLAGIGYTEHRSNPACPNPPEKAPFIKGALAEAVAMKLLVAGKGSPAIEMILEPPGDSRPPAFEPLLSTTPLSRSSETPRTPSDEALDYRSVIARSLLSTGDRATSALVLHCETQHKTLPLWHTLGFKEEFIDDRITRIVVRGLRAGNELNVYLLADRTESSACHLNDGGFVCLSLFCKNADRLHEALAGEGYQVGDCFSLTPFDSTLRIFFMRNVSGEIYEFLSVSGARARK